MTYDEYCQKRAMILQAYLDGIINWFEACFGMAHVRKQYTRKAFSA